MKDELENIKALWLKTKDTEQAQVQDANELIALAEAKKRSAVMSHLGTVIILSVTVAVLIAYFYFLFSFQDLASKIGYNLMIGGLLLRIIIELFSAVRSRGVNIADNTLASLQQSIAFLKFRKRIHGPVTIIIFVLYFVGFSILGPEFSRHITLHWLVIMYASAVVIALFLMMIIKSTIRKEMDDLNKMLELQYRLTKQNGQA